MNVNLPTNTCDGCLLRSDLCICGLAPSLCLTTPVQQCHWLLLTHTREVEKLTNTGRLLLNCLPNVALHLWQRKESLQALLQGRRAVLLFPSDEGSPTGFSSAEQVMSEFGGEGEPVLWILLDSTWQQAKKMVRQSPELQALPRLSFSVEEGASRYHLRRNQQGFSTLEAAAVILEQLSERASSTSLLTYLDTFQQHWEAHRSNRPL